MTACVLLLARESESRSAQIRSSPVIPPHATVSDLNKKGFLVVVVVVRRKRREGKQREGKGRKH